MNLKPERQLDVLQTDTSGVITTPEGQYYPARLVVELRILADNMLNHAQGLRIQQSQLLSDSTWDKMMYAPIADEDWRLLNEAHRQLYKLLGMDM